MSVPSKTMTWSARMLLSIGLLAVAWAAPVWAQPDYQGDGKADLTVFRPASGEWFIRHSVHNYEAGAGPYQYQWGGAGDIPVIADLDGDRRTDLTVYRPSTGQWFIRYSSLNYAYNAGQWLLQWGVPGDVPLSGDFDGDGRTDLTVYRPATGVWHVLRSSSNWTAASSYQWGLSTDVPVPGDYDGDRKADLAVYRPETGVWYVLRSSTNWTAASTHQWGLPQDVPVPGDYDGDGKMDLAVHRPGTGVWYVLRSNTNWTEASTYQWGLPGDIPVVADFDADGRAELTVFRPSSGEWYLRYSVHGYESSTARVYQWGAAGDQPLGAYRTAPGSTASTLRIINNSRYDVVSLTINGAQRLTSGRSIASGATADIAVGDGGTITYHAETEVYGNGGMRFTFDGRLDVARGSTAPLQLFDASLPQLLTNFGTSSIFEGNYYTTGPVTSHLARLTFYANGSWTVHDDGALRGSGTVTLVAWNRYAHFLQFKLCAASTCPVINYPLHGQDFFYANGPPQWPDIHYFRR